MDINDIIRGIPQLNDEELTELSNTLLGLGDSLSFNDFNSVLHALCVEAGKRKYNDLFDDKNVLYDGKHVFIFESKKDASDFIKKQVAGSLGNIKINASDDIMDALKYTMKFNIPEEEEDED